MPVNVKLVPFFERPVPLLVEKNMSAILVVQVNPVKAEEAPKPSIRWWTLVQFTVQVWALTTMGATEANRPTTHILRLFFILKCMEETCSSGSGLQTATQ